MVNTGHSEAVGSEPTASMTEECSAALVKVWPRLGRLLKAHLRGGGLTTPQMFVLMEVQEAIDRHAEGAQPGELARRCNLSGPAITATLDDLVEGGYCVRAHSEIDRRKVLVRLTPSGEQALAEARAAAGFAMRTMLRGWSEERMQRLLDVLRDLDEAVECTQPPRMPE